MVQCIYIYVTRKRHAEKEFTVTLIQRDSYMSTMTHKPSKLGQTDLVFGL